jgi:hypothetical protein
MVADKIANMKKGRPGDNTQICGLNGHAAVTQGQAASDVLIGSDTPRWPDETQLIFMMFDLLHENGVDLRSVPINRLCRKADVPLMRQVETFLDGAALFARSAELGRVEAHRPTLWERPNQILGKDQIPDVAA